jgi:DNA-directed RNA polymerase specialized sigma24 family protein
MLLSTSWAHYEAVYKRAGVHTISLEIRTKLSSCIQQILQIDQEIFWMRERGLAYKEITETLRLPQGTVASKYHRAKEALADCLEKAGITGVREK